MKRGGRIRGPEGRAPREFGGVVEVRDKLPKNGGLSQSTQKLNSFAYLMPMMPPVLHILLNFMPGWPPGAPTKGRTKDVCMQNGDPSPISLLHLT